MSAAKAIGQQTDAAAAPHPCERQLAGSAAVGSSSHAIDSGSCQELAPASVIGLDFRQQHLAVGLRQMGYGLDANGSHRLVLGGEPAPLGEIRCQRSRSSSLLAGG